MEIWKRSMEFIAQIYLVTEKFPQEEKFGLISQVRRASLSIALNIAEGSGAGSDKDFARYLTIAISSTYEVVCGLEISVRLKICKSSEAEKLISEADEICAMISGFISRLNRKDSAASCQLQAASSK